MNRDYDNIMLTKIQLGGSLAERTKVEMPVQFFMDKKHLCHIMSLNSVIVHLSA